MTVSKKKVLKFLFEKDYRPLTFEGLRKGLGIAKDRDIEELFSFLASLEEEGVVLKTVQGRYTPLKGKGMLVGVLQGHAQGYAFLLPEASGEADVFIPREKIKGAMHKDRVMVRLLGKSTNGHRREGEVIRILKRGNTNIVGTFQGNRHRGTVLPDDRRLAHEIRISRVFGKVDPGDKILVSITRWPDSFNGSPEGKIVEVIGPADEPGVDITSIQKKFGLPSAFPAKVLKEAERWQDEEQVLAAAAAENRRDLCALPMITIDDADAKDLDDAVSLEKTAGGYRLGVHIADVSYYVRERSALDREAARRANSVYLPDRVVPMLPAELSNGICSLNPGAHRLAISVFMELTPGGELQNSDFCFSLIRIDERLTYEGVNRVLQEEQEQLEQKYAAFSQTLADMHELAGILKEKRKRRGALDFNFPEAKVILDEQGKPLEIKVREHGAAETMIEEFMLLCNEVVADYFYRQKTPFIYRVHERPTEEKLSTLRDFLSLFNIKLKGSLSRISPRQLQKITAEIKDTPLEKTVNFMLLRSLPQAHYSAFPAEHFGLASSYYTHFTAPIRRYPDLLVHRILRHHLAGTLTKAESRKLTSHLPLVAKHASEQERVALEAERECLDLKKVEFMEGKEGNDYEGIISGVTSFGFFVELSNTVEGLVHVKRLEDDYYHFDEKKYALVGERHKKVYRLGDPLQVRLEKVDKETRTLHFLPL
ncbi:MAG: ribonuclease R [Firmicutes bacterium]|nr:ribonuclease R [Bacillota bacterium]